MNIVEFIEKNFIGRYKENVDIATLTTYRTGGIAKIVVHPLNEKKLLLLLKTLKKEKINFKVLGNGSNTLFSDDFYDGVIIKLDSLSEIKFTRNKVFVEAGASLIRVANMAVKKSLSGLEFATGIPGTIGGAIYMNAGAYKRDMGYIVESIKVITPKFEIITMTNRELNFHYRTSFLQQNKGYICISAILKLQKGDKKEMQEIVKDRMQRRMESQPLEYPSAGSVFRNPEGLFAGKLIEDLGYKGLQKGGAKISEKHSNFIINYNHATSKDIKDLIDFIKEEVKEKYNIDLKVEQEFVNWE